MPRTGGVYSPPAGTKGVPNATIQSVPYNTLIDDLAADANAPRPVTAGGTGATSASGARAALGVEVGTNVQAYDAGLQSISGLVTSADQMIYTTAADVYATTALTPFARTLLDDGNSSSALSTLGVSDFMKTVLDDGDAATARSTFGANNASNFTTGTVADARLPGTMSSKIFSGPVYLYSSSGNSALEIGKPDVINSPFIDFHSAGTVNDFDVRLIASGGAVGNGLGTLSLTAATFAANGALSAASGSFAGQVGAGSLKSTAEYIDNNSDRVLQFRTIAGTTRGMVRHDQANDAVIISTFNSAGSWYRDLYIGGASSEIQWGGNIRLGSSALFQNDGNIYMPMYGNYLSNVLDSKITADGRSYPRRVGGAPINFHWSGQGGQPSWLWGGNDGQEMYVYNPSNFNVNYANSAGSAATLSNWSGWAGTWIGASRIGGTVYQNTTGRWLPISASGGNNGIAILYGPTAATATSAHYAGYSGGNDFSTFGLVPPGWYYSFSATLNVFEARN